MESSYEGEKALIMWLMIKDLSVIKTQMCYSCGGVDMWNIYSKEGETAFARFDIDSSDQDNLEYFLVFFNQALEDNLKERYELEEKLKELKSRTVEIFRDQFKEDDEEWQREIANQEGMGVGIDSYNDAMGYGGDRGDD